MGLLKFIKHKLLDCVLKIIQVGFKIRAWLGWLEVTDQQVGIFDYKGWRWSHIVHSRDLIDAVEEFDDFHESDIVVFAYPKTGNHFLCDVIHAIYYASGLLSKERDSVLDAIHFELSSKPRNVDTHLKALRKLPHPRIVSTHLPWSLLPQKVKQNKVKLIHIMRNPKDTACSALPFYRTHIVLPDTSMTQFIKLFITGKVLYGGYIRFIREWYPHRIDQNTMYLYYEEMKQDLPTCVRRIAEFLHISLTDEQVSDISTANSFSSIKKKTFTNFIHRSGKAGGWKNELTVAQSEAMDEWISTGLEGLDDIKFTYEL